MNNVILFAVAIGSWISISGGTWQPTTQDLNGARSGLQSYVAKTAKEEQVNLPKWSLYTFQYQGRTIEKKRFIYINAYCTTPPKYSANRFVQVFDGGSCFFSVLYDPKTKTYTNLTFNGLG